MRIPDGAAAVSVSMNSSVKAGHWATGKAEFVCGKDTNGASQKTCNSQHDCGYVSDSLSIAKTTQKNGCGVIATVFFFGAAEVAKGIITYRKLCIANGGAL